MYDDLINGSLDPCSCRNNFQKVEIKFRVEINLKKSLQLEENKLMYGRSAPVI